MTAGPGGSSGSGAPNETAEARLAAAWERAVGRDSFGELLARVTENAMGVTKIGFDTLDLVVRNLRIAGRQDVNRLARQLARTEDKLERILQELEALRDGVTGAKNAGPGDATLPGAVLAEMASAETSGVTPVSSRGAARNGSTAAAHGASEGGEPHGAPGTGANRPDKPAR